MGFARGEELGSVISQLTEMAVPRAMFAEILLRIDGLMKAATRSISPGSNESRARFWTGDLPDRLDRPLQMAKGASFPLADTLPRADLAPPAARPAAPSYSTNATRRKRSARPLKP
jgi:hypothetical protein